MKKKNIPCSGCGKSALEKDEIGATKKFLGEGQLYCLNCLAEITGFEVEDLRERIDELKANGCQFFS